MAKHSYETKKVVLAYLSGEGSAGYIREKYGVARAMVLKWVAANKEFGD